MPDSNSIDRHIRHLAEGIGPRLAGSKAEEEAADYIAGHLSQSGVEVRVDSFPVASRRVAAECLRFRVGSQWEELPCSLLNASPGTGDGEVKAPLVILEPPQLGRPDLRDCAGKAVLLLGTHIEDPAQYRRLMEAGPAFLLLVDIRFPSDTLRADGLFPAHVHRYGAVPTVAIPFLRAWDLASATEAVLRVSGGSIPARSQNVVGLLRGAGEDGGPTLFATAHHDTQADCPGADDNASGVAAILELARVLAPLSRKRDICLISFGAEEQLSVGSATYVREHRETLSRRGGFVFNFDSLGSRLGWSCLDVCAEEAAGTWLSGRLEAGGESVSMTRSCIPYQDAFPFHAAGVPGCWISRRNCAAGTFYHHRADDLPEKTDAGRMARLLRPIGGALAELADARTLPFPIGIPGDLESAVRRSWEDCFGGWEGFPVVCKSS